MDPYFNFKVKVLFFFSPSSHCMSQLNHCAQLTSDLYIAASFKTAGSFLQVTDIEEVMLKYYIRSNLCGSEVHKYLSINIKCI